MIHFDCRYYYGEKPCKFKRECSGCPHYSPMGPRILIIKLSAIGDVLRTTPILTGLKKIFPESHITWLVSKSSRPILENIPLIDCLLTFDLENVLSLLVQKFSIMISLEKSEDATALAMKIDADKKIGFGMTQYGTLCNLNPESEYALRLGLSDELKFKENRLSYPEIIFGMVGLNFDWEEYILNIPEVARIKASEFVFGKNIEQNDFIIGMNTGAGPIFATKKWTIEGFTKLSELIHMNTLAKIILYGGPLEKERNAEILRRSHAPIIDNGCDHSILEFSAMIDLCNLLVTSDTMAMHIGIALRKIIVAIIGATCDQEIYLYEKGEKIVSAFDCSPCYRAECSRSFTCMDALTAEDVFEVLKRWIPKKYLR